WPWSQELARDDGAAKVGGIARDLPKRERSHPMRLPCVRLMNLLALAFMSCLGLAGCGKGDSPAVPAVALPDGGAPFDLRQAMVDPNDYKPFTGDRFRVLVWNVAHF